MNRDNYTIYLNGILFVYCSVYLGELHDFYNLLHWWDAMLHLWSGVALCYYLTKWYKQPWFALAASVSVLTTWELFEYIMDVNFELNMQKDGIKDTMEDLAIGKLGTFVGFFVYYIKTVGWIEYDD